jgi:hypothetical protein
MRAVDPEVADELDRRDMEATQREALRWRKALGMPVPEKPKPPPMSPGVALWMLAWWALGIWGAVDVWSEGLLPAILVLCVSAWVASWGPAWAKAWAEAKAKGTDR